jgi:hypothetical protein
MIRLALDGHGSFARVPRMRFTQEAPSATQTDPPRLHPSKLYNRSSLTPWLTTKPGCCSCLGADSLLRLHVDGQHLALPMAMRPSTPHFLVYERKPSHAGDAGRDGLLERQCASLVDVDKLGNPGCSRPMVSRRVTRAEDRFSHRSSTMCGPLLETTVERWVGGHPRCTPRLGAHGVASSALA